MIEYRGKKLTIMACSKCNTKCKHCYISYKGDRTPEELMELVKKFKDKYKVEINGAEILTNPAYIESYPIIGQDFVMTNGIEINNNPKILDYLISKGIKQIFMSYHFGIQDKISLVEIKKLEENIQNILKRGLKLKLYVTVTRENYKYVHEIVEKAKQYGAMSVRFTNYIKQGNAINLDDENILNPEEIQYFLDEVEQERQANPQSIMDIERCGTFGKGKSSKFNCYAITNNIILTPDNNIYPCLFLAKPGYEIGYYDGDKLQLFEKYQNDGQECIVREYCNYGNNKILRKKIGGNR